MRILHGVGPALNAHRPGMDSQITATILVAIVMMRLTLNRLALLSRPYRWKQKIIKQTLRKQIRK